MIYSAKKNAKDEDGPDNEKPSIKDLNDVTKIAGVDIRVYLYSLSFSSLSFLSSFLHSFILSISFISFVFINEMK